MRSVILLVALSLPCLPVSAQGFAGGFANGLQQGMQLRLQQQQLEMMERAEKREEERHKAYLLQQESEKSREQEIRQDLSRFIERHPEYNNQERLQELQVELQRLRKIPENRHQDFSWFLQEGHEALSVKDEVNTAKNNNPMLVHWEGSDPLAWDEALRQDEILRTHPDWATKPYAERFIEVVRRVRAIMPEASTPKLTGALQ